MSWASKRETTRIEDRAYSLMGLFGIYMPLIYGERETAFVRLQEEIIKVSNDHTIFAWRQDHEEHHTGLLASSPAAFAESYNIIQTEPFRATSLGSPITFSSMGIHLELRFIGMGPQGLGLAILHCKDIQEENKMIAIYLKDCYLTMEQFQRVGHGNFHQVDLTKFNPFQYPVRRICVEGGRMTRRWKLDKRIPAFQIHVYSNDVLAQLMNFGDPTAIFKAAASGDEELVWLLLTRSDVNIEARADRFDPTPLECAIENGKLELVKTLLRRGARSDVKSMEFQSLLLLALRNGHEAVVKLFLDRGADIELNDDQRQKILFMAGSSGNLEDTVNLVLDRGAEIDAKNVNGQTPLIIATENGNENIVKLLLDRGAKIDAKGDFDRSPLHFAAEKANENIVKLLLDKGAELDIKNLSDETPLYLAAEKGNENIVKLLLERGPRIDTNSLVCQSPLHLAAWRGNENIVKLLLDKGAELDVKNSSDQSPLHLAAEKGNENIVKLLLERGARIDTKGFFGRTPLILAAENGNENMVKLLLERGASFELRDHMNHSALKCAAINGSTNVVKILLNAGAKVDKDIWGNTPLEAVKMFRGSKPEIVEMLREAERACQELHLTEEERQS
ncbi:HET-domain-containing protein [Penicillium verhagenii]|uniref:HET-domain-containing protein n=1 Tax=Penicillium verhagenii TaxID=1562060 RepID=UPI0025457F2A|nr:HET-domain-containing protein [Penicillium verhagenii]KAJ5930996.1 HET-domain-containing protein [Penicillium verhagenii]